MATIGELNAAFDAVKPAVMAMVPGMFQGYITDSEIIHLVRVALHAAEKARAIVPEPKV